MILFLSILLPLGLLAAAMTVGIFLLHRRSSAARQQLAQELHDRALALDQRADLLQRQLDRLEMHRRIDDVDRLIDHGERAGKLSAAVAERLRGHTLELHREGAA